MSAGPSVGWSVGWSLTCFFLMPKMGDFLYENHWGNPTLILLNVLDIMNVLKMSKDLSLAYWALFV